MSLIYDNERMSDLWLVTVGIRIRSWDFTVSFARRLW